MKDTHTNAADPDTSAQAPQANIGKFIDPDLTATGERRASVAFSNPQTIWFNTGTLCNIECVNCYIDSSPTNDALVYLSADDVAAYLDELETLDWGVQEIAFTGGEPFMNPQMIEMTRLSLTRGYAVLILTNAMLPMMRPNVREGLLALKNQFGDKLTLRVSLDHWTEKNHDEMRGKNGFKRTLMGMAWLRDNGFKMAVAARALWDESDAEARAGFKALFAEHGFDIDPDNPAETVIFPEMDLTAEVPEITTQCWGILNKSPEDIMCASQRMIVKRKGAERPTVAACTLLPYEAEFDLGPTLAGAAGEVKLNHPHCAKFCVLGGASCSA